MSDETDAPGPRPAAVSPLLQARPPEELKAVLISGVGDLAPGKIVRGPAPDVRPLISAGKARLASPADIGIAGGRTVRLPKA